MKESYLIPAFRQTVRRQFPTRQAELIAAMEARLLQRGRTPALLRQMRPRRAAGPFQNETIIARLT